MNRSLNSCKISGTFSIVRKVLTPQQVFLEDRSEQFGAAVILRFPNEDRRAFHADEANVNLKILSYVLTSMIMVDHKSLGNAFSIRSEVLPHTLTNWLQCLKTLKTGLILHQVNDHEFHRIMIPTWGTDMRLRWTSEQGLACIFLAVDPCLMLYKVDPLHTIATIDINTDKGTFSERMEYSYGDSAIKAMSNKESEFKFKNMAARVIGETKAAQTIEMASELDVLDEIRKLTALYS